MAATGPRRYISVISTIAPVSREGFAPGTMSSITPDPTVNRAGLDPRSDQLSLDDLRRDHGLGGVPQNEVAEASYAAPPTAAESDSGEDVLNASAWDGVPEGSRLLGGDLAFENALGAMDLSQAADQGADAVLASFG